MIERDYRMCPESRDIFARLWPETKRATLPPRDQHRNFLRHMRMIQAELICAHYQHMDEKTQERAEKTLQWIDQQG